MSVRLIIYCLLLALPASQVCADMLLRPSDEIRLPMAEGWVTGGSESGFPIHLVNHDLSAEMQIFRSEIAEDEAIADSRQLRRAVEDIIADVILSLPEAELLTNTGYHDRGRVRFVLEFVSFDTASVAELHHRLMGVLYRHPDGHQLLFTLWGKVPNPPPEAVLADFEFMQNGFDYFGPSMDYRTFLLGGVVVALLLILRIRRRGRSATEPTIGTHP